MPRFAALLVAALSLGISGANAPAEAQPKHCPPGLAKKNPPCIPPGQVGKSWTRGDRIHGDYVLIPRADWQRLALRDYQDGSTYLRVDNQILRVARDTLTVIEAVRILDRAFN